MLVEYCKLPKRTEAAAITLHAQVVTPRVTSMYHSLLVAVLSRLASSS